MSDIDWSATLSDDAAWAVLEQRPDLAKSAMAYLTDTISEVDQQLTYAKADAATRMSADEYAEHRDWRARAIGFKRILERRRRDLIPVMKQHKQLARDHEADARFHWARSGDPALSIEDAFKRGFVLGRST